MTRLRYMSVNVAAFVIALIAHSVAWAEDREGRIAAGKLFLTDSRIDQWEKIFTEGIHEMGRIAVTKDGKVASEAWFEKQFKLGRIFESQNRVTTAIANPEYFAQVRTRDKESRTGGVFPAVQSGWAYVSVLPFMIGSSVNFTNPLIPAYLKSGRLQIHDYRVEGKKHIFELEDKDEADKGLIELVFDDDLPSLLPVETTFGKGTPYARHFISSDFREVAGYSVPMRVEEKSKKDVVTTEIFPDDRLDHEKCRLSYYGLPEPGELAVSDFGRKTTSWFGILSIALIVGMVAVGGYFWARSQNAVRNK